MGDSPGPVLVGWDEGAQASDALALGRLLARECGLGLHVVHCRSADGRGEASATGDGAGDMTLVDAQSPAEGLQDEARRVEAETIVIGSTHRGPLGRLVPGSVAGKLLHGSPCAVTVAPAGYDGGDDAAIRMIAVAFDGSDASRAAVAEAVRLARAAQAGIKLISVVPHESGLAGMAVSYQHLHAADKEYRRGALAELARSLPHEMRPAERLRDGDPSHEIVAECETGVDLLVMGSRGRGPVRRVMLGSVSARVVRAAACPVMIVPAGTPDAGAPAPTAAAGSSA